MNPPLKNCERCGKKFRFYRRKRVCFECKESVCKNCISEALKVESNARSKICICCNILSRRPLQREELMGLRVKDLQKSLATKRINTELCLEKVDLVDLLIYESLSTSFSESSWTSIDLIPAYLRSQLNTPESESFSENLESRIPNLTEQSSYIAEDSFRGQESFSGLQTASQYQEVLLANPVSSHQSVKLEEIKSVDGIRQLSVKQCKEILVLNRVNFHGVIEKEELVGIVERLWRHETNKDAVTEDKDLCKICMDAVADSVMLECGHVATCITCGKKLAECPICRQYIIRIVKIFKS